MVLLVGDGSSLHMAKETSLFIFANVSMVTELSFHPCEYSKKVTRNLPGFLSRKKDFWVVFPKRVDQDFKNNCFRYLRKGTLNFQVLWLLN